jgi:hypothetical protein
MPQNPNIGTLVGLWTYRSLINDPDLATDFGQLQFGKGNVRIDEAPMGVFKGRIYDTGWALDLNGAIGYGMPWTVRFQGTGTVGGEQWIYDYTGFVVPPWPNGVEQRPAIVGSVIRTLPHSGGGPGTVAPAGVVASFYAVRQD